MISCLLEEKLPLPLLVEVPLPVLTEVSTLTGEPPFLIASLLYRRPRVTVPALPSAVSPLRCWKAITAASVTMPKLPSAVPLRYPSSFSRRCSARTASPSLPLSRVSPVLAAMEEAFAALLEYRAFNVSGPATPSSHRPLVFFWKARTASSVASLYSPVAFPPRYPNWISRFCRVRTRLPLDPACR